MSERLSHIVFRTSSVVIIVAFFLVAPSIRAEDLTWILPTNEELKTLKTSDDPQMAAGPELFQLINGGAELFHEYGFKQAILQDYTFGDGNILSLEVYEMASSFDAYGIFTMRGGTEGNSAPFGHEGLLASYYTCFWKGTYFVTITGMTQSAETLHALRILARAVDKKISDAGEKPALVNWVVIPGQTPEYLKYFRRFHRFDNWFTPEPKCLKDVQEGVSAKYKHVRVMVLMYPDQKSSGNSMLAMKKQYGDSKEDGKSNDTVASFSFENTKNGTVSIHLHKESIFILSADDIKDADDFLEKLKTHKN